MVSKILRGQTSTFLPWESIVRARAHSAPGVCDARSPTGARRNTRRKRTRTRDTHPPFARAHTDRRRAQHKVMALGLSAPTGVAPVATRARASTRRAASATPIASRALGDAKSVFSRDAFFANAVVGRGDACVANAGARGRVVMAAKVAGYIKLAIEAGKASPAPPIGPALGAKVCSFFRLYFLPSSTRVCERRNALGASFKLGRVDGWVRMGERGWCKDLVEGLRFGFPKGGRATTGGVAGTREMTMTTMATFFASLSSSSTHLRNPRLESRRMRD